MKSQTVALALSAINLAILCGAISRSPAAASSVDGEVVRTRKLELIDEHDKVRSSLKVEADGEVVLRLFDQNGTIRVKLGANEGGSGLLLADESAQPGVHLLARQTGTKERPNTTRITITGAGGKQHVIEP